MLFLSLNLFYRIKYTSISIYKCICDIIGTFEDTKNMAVFN